MSHAAVGYEIPASIAQRLQALRSSITIWFVIDGLWRVLLSALAIFAVDLLLDWVFKLDRTSRSVLWVMMIGAIAMVAWRKLLVPLTSSINDDALLLEVERKHKELGESVISAAQFARISDLDRLGVSRSMVAATIDRGVSEANRIAFQEVLNGQRFWTNVFLLVVALVLTGGLGVGIAMGGPLQIWANRNLMLGDARWPQETELEIVGVKDGVIRLPRGENWTQLVRVVNDSKVPDSVFIDFYPSRGRPSQTAKKLPDNDFEVTFTNVIEEFEFRARGGDAVTDPVQVKLVEPPAPKDLKLTVRAPKYAKEMIEELPAGKGPYYVLKGSTLIIKGKANKPLSKAELVIERGGADLSPVRMPLTLKKGGSDFSGELGPEQLEAGKYILELTDEGGLKSKRPTSFAVNLKNDREPRFAAPRVHGVSGMVIGKARIPYAAKITDDFAVTKVVLAYKWRGESSDAGDQGTTEPGSLAGTLPSDSVDLSDVFDMEKLNLQPGSTLTLVIEATDNDDVSGPNVGKSPEFAIRVVTEEQLRSDILRREKEQRQEFERLLKNQEDLLVDVKALAAGAGDAADFTDEQRLTLMGIQKRQNLVGTNVSGVATIFDAITIEVLNNRLEEPGGTLEKHLRDEIIAPMRKIVDKEVVGTVLALDRSRRVAQNAADRTQALKDAQTRQQEIVDTMNEILKHMAKAEGFQEAINLLYALDKEQKGVMVLTEEERAARIKKLLEERNKKEAEKKPEEKKPDEAKP
jgi:hypothetical protein